ncbi:MAG: glycosyltransferase family 39 protein [Chromatiales bacterium]|nr:glycosyltransferase family 39 protein [Chromatiales bacterium]
MRGLESRRLFFHLLWVTLLLKFAWAAWMPLSGDEAYFYLWAKNPGMGYYDHPPMVGWWLTLLLWFGDANWWLRTPAVLLGSGLAYGIYHLLRGVVDEDRAVMAGMLFLLSPLVLLNVIVTTDTPLIIFSFLSAWAFSHAIRENGWRWYLLSGLLLGAAFLAKYFAVLLGLTYAVYILLYRRNRHHITGMLWLSLAVVPFAALNLWWNYCHCWDNVLFNVYNRHTSGGALHVHEYLLMLIYMVTPPLIWYLLRERKSFLRGLREGDTFLFLLLLPLVLFLVVSVRARIGLHWVLAFYPFLFIALARILSAIQLRRALIFMVGFSLLHVVALVWVLMLPHDYWKSRPAVYDGVLIGFYADEFIKRLDDQGDGYHWATGSYVDSAILEYKSGRRTSVFGKGSKYGRQDDMLTDWRQLDGKNIAVLLYREMEAQAYAGFFHEAEIIRFPVRQRDFYLIRGKGFNYKRYRDDILRYVRDRYYRYPDFLPDGECYLYDRYFPDTDIVRLQR